MQSFRPGKQLNVKEPGTKKPVFLIILKGLREDYKDQFLAPTGSQGVKMSCASPCMCHVSCVSVGYSLRIALEGLYTEQAGKQAVKHLECIQSEPCSVGACYWYTVFNLS